MKRAIVLLSILSMLLVTCCEKAPPPTYRHDFSDSGGGCIRLLIVEESTRRWGVTDLKDDLQAALDNLEYEVVAITTVYNDTGSRIVSAEIYYKVPGCGD